jgi:hypothetical protein
MCCVKMYLRRILRSKYNFKILHPFSLKARWILTSKMCPYIYVPTYLHAYIQTYIKTYQDYGPDRIWYEVYYVTEGRMSKFSVYPE